MGCGMISWFIRALFATYIGLVFVSSKGLLNFLTSMGIVRVLHDDEVGLVRDNLSPPSFSWDARGIWGFVVSSQE